MRILIKHKLFVAFLFTTTVTFFGVQAVVQYSYENGLIANIETRDAKRIDNIRDVLRSWYEEQGSWSALQRSELCWLQVMVASRPEIRRFLNPFASGCKAPDESWDPASLKKTFLKWPKKTLSYTGQFTDPLILRVQLLDRNMRVRIGPSPTFDPNHTDIYPIVSADDVVGYLGIKKIQANASFGELFFIQNPLHPVSLIGAFFAVFSTLIAFLIAHSLVRPMRVVAKSVRQLSKNDYNVNIEVTSDDELGELARNLNELSRTLSEHEQSQRRWVADISHELRTPISIIQGEIEALQDGVRELTKERMNSLHSEVVHLSKLVSDLYELSLSDIGALSYRKEELDLKELLLDNIYSMQSLFDAESIKVDVSVPDEDVILYGDHSRLTQLFSNLMRNSLKYTDSPGLLKVHLVNYGAEVLIRFEDSSPGVPVESLPYLFDRLYRVDVSRNRNRGGAGIGLAMCQNIVYAHSGKISAQLSPLGGLCVDIRIPVSGVITDDR